MKSNSPRERYIASGTGLIGVLGLVLICVPLFLRFGGDYAALRSSMVLGALALISGYLAKTRSFHDSLYWAMAIVDRVMLFLPLVLGFSRQAIIMWVSVALGAELLASAASRYTREHSSSGQ